MSAYRDEVEIYKDRHGDYRWRRVSSNGKIVGTSTEGYINKSYCKENAERNMVKLDIIDRT